MKLAKTSSPLHSGLIPWFPIFTVPMLLVANGFAAQALHASVAVKERIEQYRSGDYGHAMSGLLQAATEGDMLARAYVCEAQLLGRGMPRKASEPHRWCVSAADAGVPLAAGIMGMFYAGGTSFIPADRERAMRLVSYGIEHGDVRSIRVMGEIYQYGLGVPQDSERASAWYEKASAAGDPRAMAMIAVRRIDSNEPAKIREGVALLHKSANSGDASGEFLLGECHALGICGEKNMQEALRWYRRAAEHQSVDAQLRLAHLYSQGKVLPSDPVQSHHWSETAARAGSAAAQLLTALDYGRGLGVARDENRAIEWMSKAATAGHASAQAYLALWYTNGYGSLKPDLSKAVYWHELCANNPGAQDYVRAESRFQWGLALVDGRGVTSNPALGAQRIKEAADEGSVGAQYVYGKLLSEGRHVSRDVAQGALYWRKAAARDDINSQFELGMADLLGRELPRNHPEALQLLIKAEPRLTGYRADLAALMLGLLAYEGTGVPHDTEAAREWWMRASHSSDPRIAKDANDLLSQTAPTRRDEDADVGLSLLALGILAVASDSGGSGGRNGSASGGSCISARMQCEGSCGMEVPSGVGGVMGAVNNSNVSSCRANCASAC